MHTITIEQTYNAPVNLVWQCLTSRAMMKEWYFDFADDFQLQPGAVFEWTAGDNESRQWLHRGKMLEIIPDEKLVHSWEYPGYTGTSTVTWSLLKVDETTTSLTLTHDFNTPFDNKVEALKTGNFEKGWTHILTISLKEYLDKIQK